MGRAQGQEVADASVPDATAPEPTPDAETPPAPVAPVAPVAPEPPSAAAVPTPAPAPAPDLRVSPAPAEPSEAQDVIVVGTRLAKTAGSAHVVNEAQLERFEYDDPHAALQQIPGVYVRQEDGIGLRPNIAIRGANPDRSKKITLMEDGVLFGPAPYSAPAAYFFPLLTRMTRIRVLDGPAAIAYGPQTVGGAIDFVTRSIPRTPTASVDLAGGEYGYFKTHAFAGISNEQFGVLIEGVHLHNDGFKVLPSGADTGSTRNEWMIKSSYIVDPAARATHEFTLKLTYSGETSNETYLGLSDADFRADPYQRYPGSALDQMKNHRTSVVLTHVLDAPDQRLKLTTTLYRHDYARIWRKLNRFRGGSVASVLADPMDPTNAEYFAVLRGKVDGSVGMTALFVGPNDRTFVSQGVQSTLQLRELFTGPVEHRIEVGARVHNDLIERRHSEEPFDLIGGELVPITTESELITAANEASTYAVAGHVLDAMSWGHLMLTPGVRLEVIASSLDDRLAGTRTNTAVSALMPGVGAFYSLLPELGLLAGVYRGFSPPPPGEKHLDPEYSVNYEAGARFTPKHGRFELIGFYNDYTNMTDVCTFSSGCLNDNLDRQFDAGSARIYGFEAFAGYTLPIGRASLPLTAAYTYTRAEFRHDFESSDPIYGTVAKGDEIPYVPRHQLNVTAAFESRWFGLNAALTHVAAMREVAGSAPYDQSLVTDALTTLDLGADVRVFPNLRIYGNVRNVTDEAAIVSRRPYGARPNAPRWIQVGIKGKLE